MPKPLSSPGRLLADRAKLEAKASRIVAAEFNKRHSIRSIDQLASNIAARLSDIGVGDANVIEMDLVRSDLFDRMVLAQQQGKLKLADFADRAKNQGRNLAAVQYNSEVSEELADEGYSAKRWVSMRDKKVRPSHVAADGQTVALDSPYQVGGYSLSYPADPTGPAEEVVNCRCHEVGVRGDDSSPEQWFNELDDPVDQFAQGSPEQQALADFANSNGVNFIVNRVLRHPNRRWGADSLKSAEAAKRGMDGAFRSAGQTLTTSRRFTRRAPSVPKGAQVGGVVKDFGYTSASSVSAGSGVTEGAGWTIDIVAPTGTRVLRGNSATHEVVLPRGTRYRVAQRDDANHYMKLRIMS